LGRFGLSLSWVCIMNCWALGNPNLLGLGQPHLGWVYLVPPAQPVVSQPWRVGSGLRSEFGSPGSAVRRKSADPPRHARKVVAWSRMDPTKGPPHYCVIETTGYSSTEECWQKGGPPGRDATHARRIHVLTRGCDIPGNLLDMWDPHVITTATCVTWIRRR
jgi:hypothetical protein